MKRKIIASAILALSMAGGSALAGSAVAVAPAVSSAAGAAPATFYHG